MVGRLMKSGSVRFSLGLPQVLDASGASLLTTFATRSEQAGFAGLWTIDNAAGGPTASRPVLDAVHALSFVASATTTIRLGIAVLVLPRRNPVLLAKELATLDQLSRGRLVVGVGAGRDDGTVAALGFPVDRPLQRVVESVAGMRAVWNETPAEHHGDIWSFSDARVEPKPLQRPAPPIWFGVGGPKSLRHAARLADGWIGAGGSSVDDFAAQVRRLEEALHAEGRDPRSLPRAKRVYIGVERTRAEARRRLATALDGLYGMPGFTDRTGVFGAREECVEQLARIIQAGAGELVLTPVYDHLRQLDELAAVMRAVVS